MGLCLTSTCCRKSKGKLVRFLLQANVDKLLKYDGQVISKISSCIVSIETQLCGRHRAVRIVHKKKVF